MGNAMKLGTQTGSMINHLISRTNEPAPVVGMGCTFLHWTDRSAAEIVTVNEQTGVIGVRGLKAIRTDGLGMTDAQAYRYEQKPDAPVIEYARNRWGDWARVERYTKAGKPVTKKNTGPKLSIGHASEYRDFSF